MKRSLFYTAGSIRTNNAVGSISLTKRQQMNLSYDLNGNIKKMGRYSDAATQMDSLIYRYTSNTNRLKHVDDTLTISGAFTTDIDDQSPGNYTYDASGNLLSDTKERIYAIEWDARGKVRKIKKDKVQVDGQFLSDLEYIYNSMGQRIVKIVKPHHKPGASVVLSPQWNWTYTFYQLDAQGNVLATYERKYLPQGGTSYKSEYKLVEQYVYAGSRLGSIEQNLGAYNSNFTASVTVTGTNDDDEYLVPTSSFGSNTYTVNPYGGTYYDYAYKTGQRHYEQTNYLGNVMSTISDRKIPVDRYNFINTGGSYTHSLSSVIGTYVTGVGLLTHKISTGGDSKADGWMAEVETYSDYYPFGQVADNRFLTPGNHRFGAGGQECEKEITNTNSHYSAEYWMYDSRLGRRWNIDPVIQPWEGSYTCFGDNPIRYTDPDGRYKTEKKANKMRDRYIKQTGADASQVSEVYKSGKEWVFNDWDNYLGNTSFEGWEMVTYSKETKFGYQSPVVYGDYRDKRANRDYEAELTRLDNNLAGGSLMAFTGAVGGGLVAGTSPIWAPIAASYVGVGMSYGMMGLRAIGSNFLANTSFQYLGLKSTLALTDGAIQYGITGKVDITSSLKYFNPAYGIGLDISLDVNVVGDGPLTQSVFDKSIRQITFDALSSILGYGAGKYIEYGILKGTTKGLEGEIMKGIPDQVLNGYTIGGQSIFDNEKK